MHPEFGKVEKEREPFDTERDWKMTQGPNVTWKPGSGSNSGEWKAHSKISIDPYAGRSAAENYKLLISAIVPRPIAFVSTESSDGKRNLAPYSYFNIGSSDPPIFTIGFSGGKETAKDSLRNILETGELTINIISEWFAEAADYCAIDAPPHVDEWKLSGLTPLNSEKVKPPHVAESAFSIEAKLIHSHEWKSQRDPSKATGVLCIVEGVNFHVREDIMNSEHSQLDINKLKPVARLGGITYGRLLDGYEKPRPVFKNESSKKDVNQLLE